MREDVVLMYQYVSSSIPPEHGDKLAFFTRNSYRRNAKRLGAASKKCEG